ncbi:hypothetical protein D3C78_1382960 [compost metagenome]
MPRSLVIHRRMSPSKNQVSMNGLMYRANQPVNRITGIRIAASQPSGTRRRSDSGRRLQAKPATRTPSGINRNRLNTPGRCPSRNGARNRPAKKPRITVGIASISSITGLTLRRMPGAMK